MAEFWRQMLGYCGFDDDAAAHVRTVRATVEPHIPALVDAFYAELDRHPEARAVFSGEAQRARLKQTLHVWLRELLTGPYDDAYFERRLRIGRRHVSIGLPQRFMFGGIAVLRAGIGRVLVDQRGEEAAPGLEAIGRLLDLELAVMLESYAESRIDLERAGARASTFQEALALEASIRAVEDDVNRLVASEEALGDVCRGLSSATGFEVVAIGRRDPREARVAIVAQHGLDDGLVPGIDLGLPETPPPAAMRDLGLSTIVFLPVRSGAEALGVLALASPRTVQVGEAQRGILQAVADHLGTAWKTRILLARQAEAERVETVARFSRVLAHEVRNPLNAMSLQAALMRRRLANVPEDTRRPLEAALLAFEQETKRLNELVEHYLLIGRAGQLRREVIAAHELLRSVLAVHEIALSEAHIAMELVLETDVRIEVDVPKITQVLHNLVRNAIDAMAGGGHLKVRAWCAGDRFRVSFADSGPGVSHPDQVFEPFFTTKSLGTGLGLPVAREIARAHGGDLELVSGARIGAEFVLLLPLGVGAHEEDRTGSGP